MDEANYVDISADDRELKEIIEEQWFTPDQLPEPVTLTIARVFADTTNPDQIVLAFEGDSRWFRVNRANRLVFESLFGTAKQSIGRPVTLAKTLAWGRREVVSLMEPGSPGTALPKPPMSKPRKPRKPRSTDEVNDK
ncbi:MAG: hypothetical protein JSS49_07950 [Planctomycetes bacterium]|nr:hypothetical protein [Planctomycetota bacterium]